MYNPKLNIEWFKNFVDEHFECTITDDVAFINIKPYGVCIEYVNIVKTKEYMLEQLVNYINEQYCLMVGDYIISDKQEIKDILERNVKYV